MPRFRVTDQWKLGFHPVEFASKIDITINCEEYAIEGVTPLPSVRFWANHTANLDPWDYSEEQIAHIASKRRGPKPISTLLVELESLFGFKSGTSITFNLSLTDIRIRSTLEKQEWLCDNVMPVVFPTLQRLMGAGQRIFTVLIGQKNYECAWDVDETNLDWDGETDSDRFIAGCNPASLSSFSQDFWKVSSQIYS